MHEQKKSFCVYQILIIYSVIELPSTNDAGVSLDSLSIHLLH